MSIKTFCCIGHVDAGKSTIIGHLYAKCQMVSSHELDKLQANSNERQKWSNITDINEEEQVKGKTHEFNFIPLIYKNREYQMIDTPGHKIFIRSLIEGLSSIDSNQIIGCLILSMAKGEFESGWKGGSTKEDVILARACGIENLIVLVNKMDLIDWSEEIFNQTVVTVTPFLKKCRFKTINFIPISGYQGINLIERGTPEWYKGKCLLETIDDIEVVSNKDIPIALNNFTSFKANFQMTGEGIVSSGLLCTLHYSGQEYDVMIDKIIGKTFIKENDIAEVIIKSNKPIIRSKTRRFILRTDRTVGFGKIDKVKA